MLKLSNLLAWLLPIGLLRLDFLDFGGGGGSSASTTNNITETHVQDKRVVADGGSAVVGDFSRVEFTDLGAIEKGAELGLASMLGMTKVATENTALAGRAFDITGQSINNLAQSYATNSASSQSFIKDMVSMTGQNMKDSATSSQSFIKDILGVIGTSYKDAAAKGLDATNNAMNQIARSYSEANSSAQSVASGNKTLVIGGMILVGLFLAMNWKRK